MTAPVSRWLKPAAVPFVIAVAATSWCAWSTGAGLALFFGAVLLSALYVPALTLAAQPNNRWIPPLAAGIGIAACWAISLFVSDVSPGELLRCVAVCWAFLFAVAGTSSLLTRLRLPPPLAAGVALVIALLWLTWPIWLSHGLNQSRVNALVIAHPLLAINGALQHLGAWDRAPLAYQRLTILNQDIPYHLPRSIIPAIVLHAALAAIDPALSARQRASRRIGRWWQSGIRS
jgi:hypothetical protein